MKRRCLTAGIVDEGPIVFNNIKTAHHRLESLEDSFIKGLGSAPDLVNIVLIEHVSFLIVVFSAAVNNGVSLVVSSEDGVLHDICGHNTIIYRHVP